MHFPNDDRSCESPLKKKKKSYSTRGISLYKCLMFPFSIPGGHKGDCARIDPKTRRELQVFERDQYSTISSTASHIQYFPIEFPGSKLTHYGLPF